MRVESEWADFKRLITEVTEKKEEDDEVITECRMRVNGIDIKNEKIVKNGVTYAKVRGLENAGFEVEYNEHTKLVTLKNKVSELPLKIDGESTSVEAINIEGHNFVPIRSIAAALGLEVDWKKGTVILKTPPAPAPELSETVEAEAAEDSKTE